MSLSDIRIKIDSIDSQLMDLLTKRANLVHSVGVVKKEHGLPIFAPEREQAVYDRLVRLNANRLPQESVVAIFREIMSTALKLEDELCIAYLGPQGSWTHQAAVSKFGHSVHYTECPNFDSVFHEVNIGKAAYGIVPIENSTGGSVVTTLDLFMESDLQICSQLYLPIEQCLLSTGEKQDIETIYSHPQALAQCRNFIVQNFPKAKLIETASTSYAAHFVQQANDRTLAAIASPLCAEIYKLNTLETSIQNEKTSATRFFVIGEKPCPPTGEDQTSLMFIIKHEPGSLVKALQIFETNNINITSIQSRPSKVKAWEYAFFIDIMGHSEDTPVKQAITELKKECLCVRILGCYPAKK